MGENSCTIVKTDRDISVSYIRMIATIMIVVCHIFQYYNNKLAWWFNVGVQVFFIISGYLYGTRTIRNIIGFYKKQISKVMIPFWIYLCVATLLFVFCQNSQLSLKTVLLAFTGAKPFIGLEHLWFIPYIVVCYLLIPVLQELKNRWSMFSITKMLVFVILLIVAVEVLGVAYSFYFSPSRINCFIIGYFLPAFLGAFKRKKYLIVLNWGVAIAAVILTILRIILNKLCSDANGVMASLVGIYGEYTHVMLGLAIFVVLKTLLSNTKPSMLTKLSDKFSYYIYITHHLFILSEFSLLGIIPSVWISMLAICISVALSSVCLCYLTDIFNKMLLRQK